MATNFPEVSKEMHAELNIVATVREREQMKESAAAKIVAAKKKGDEISDPVTALLMNVEKALVEIGNKRYYNMISVIRLTSTYRKSNLR